MRAHAIFTASAIALVLAAQTQAQTKFPATLEGHAVLPAMTLVPAPANAIGDFNLIDATSGLVIERDDTEGDVAQACVEGAPKPDCFNVPARFNRIDKVDLAQADADGLVKKVGYID